MLGAEHVAACTTVAECVTVYKPFCGNLGSCRRDPLEDLRREVAVMRRALHPNIVALREVNVWAWVLGSNFGSNRKCWRLAPPTASWHCGRWVFWIGLLNVEWKLAAPDRSRLLQGKCAQVQLAAGLGENFGLGPVQLLQVVDDSTTSKC